MNSNVKVLEKNGEKKSLNPLKSNNLEKSLSSKMHKFSKISPEESKISLNNSRTYHIKKCHVLELKIDYDNSYRR